MFKLYFLFPDHKEDKQMKFVKKKKSILKNKRRHPEKTATET
jgi:hypothetical protein